MPPPKSHPKPVLTKDELKAMDDRVGRNVRDMRDKRQITITQLSAGCGISFQQLQKYESGINRISASRLIQIANVMDVDVCDLLDQTVS